MEKNIVIVRGGGDLASGVAVCLHEAGFGVLVTELAQPLVVRRAVSFAEAVEAGACIVDGIPGKKARGVAEALELISEGMVAVMVDPECGSVESIKPMAVVDGRMLKKNLACSFGGKIPVIGLGPGFEAGVNCWAAIETNRGPELGKILWQGSPQPDTGQPAAVRGYTRERVLYPHREGIFRAVVKIGEIVEVGQIIGDVQGEPIKSQIRGVVRGMLRDGVYVTPKVKIGDIDPTCEVKRCYKVSDKARIIGESVVRALKSIDHAG